MLVFLAKDLNTAHQRRYLGTSIFTSFRWGQVGSFFKERLYIFKHRLHVYLGLNHVTSALSKP